MITIELPEPTPQEIELAPKLGEEFNQWQAEYDAWMQQAVQKYTTITSK